MSRTGNPAAVINNLDLFEGGRWGIRSYLHCRSCAIDQLLDVPIDKNGDDVMVIYLRPLADGGSDKRGNFGWGWMGGATSFVLGGYYSISVIGGPIRRKGGRRRCSLWLFGPENQLEVSESVAVFP